jgi:hypothetical protein
MARFSVYAEVVTPEHPQSKLYAAGKVAKQPGRLLRDYLDESGGTYEFRMPVPEDLQAKLLRVASMTADQSLAEVAAAAESVISLEHLRNLDPDTTRIVCGQRLDYTQEEAVQLGLRDQDRPGPEKQITG